MNTQEVLASELTVNAFLERPPSVAEDTTLERSIRDTGVQQPLVAVRIGDTLQVVDGGRRLIIAKRLGIPKIRVTIYDVPEDKDARAYPLELRFHLDQHRQDLLPSQRAQLLAKIKEAHGFGNTEMAAYLGVAAESIRNWLDPLNYVPEVIEVLDSGKITMNSARIFVGMTPHGQKYILKHHIDELTGSGGKDGLATKLRRQYPPMKHRNFYENPEVIERNLDIAKQRRKAVQTRVSNTTAEEKKRLLGSIEMKKAEISANKEELAEIKEDINFAIPNIAAIFRNPKLLATVPKEILPQLEAFADAYPAAKP